MIGTLPLPMPLVVLGASGGIGRGVVQAALDRGRPVIAVARDAEALAALRPLASKALLTLLPGSVADDHAGAQLAERLRRLDRPLAGVVACVCGHSQAGRLLNQPADQLRRRLDEDLLPHLAAARHLLPLLAERGRNSTYVLIGGPGGEHPWAGYGHRSIAAAALRMLTRVLHDEARVQGVRVQLLTVDSPVRTQARDAHCCPRWPSALVVGQQALALVDRDDQPAIPPVIVPAVFRDGEPWPLPHSASDAAAGPRGRAPASPPARRGVESAPAGSSELESANTERHDAAAADVEPALLPEGCQQPVRTLLKNLLTPARPPPDPSPHTSLPSPLHDKERPS